MSIAAAWCGNGSGSAKSQAVRLTGSDREQIPPHLLTHHPQRIELLVVKLCPPAHSRFTDLPEPLGTMARCIDLLAGTRNGPTAIDGLHPRHDPSEILGDREITAHQFLQAS